MASEPSWEDIFTSQPESRSAPAPELGSQSASAPTSRRQLRESEGRVRVQAASEGRGRGNSSPPRGGPPPRRRGKAWIWVLSVLVILLGGVGAVGAYVWLNYEDRVREVLGWELPNDYDGDGNGEEVVVVIQANDIGSDVAATLHQEGVTLTFDAFYELLLAEDPEPTFLPGNYSLEKEMSARAALDALLDPASRITDRVTIPEGTVLPSALAIFAETTGTPIEDWQAAAADHLSYGLPANAPSLEGYLFPATYQLDPGQDARAVLQMLVNEMFSRLDAAGVAPENRHAVLTMAALIQREAGSNPDDFYKVSRVFQNRIDAGWKLESDATVHYGKGQFGTVFTSPADRADASNPYNTYANNGLPIGPIGLPGELAIDAALNPVDGPWFFFVTVDLATGETVFSETADEHQAAAEQLYAWCEASEENASYCE